MAVSVRSVCSSRESSAASVSCEVWAAPTWECPSCLDGEVASYRTAVPPRRAQFRKHPEQSFGQIRDKSAASCSPCRAARGHVKVLVCIWVLLDCRVASWLSRLPRGRSRGQFEAHGRRQGPPLAGTDYYPEVWKPPTSLPWPSMSTFFLDLRAFPAA